jgi:hypothetical protein
MLMAKPSEVCGNPSDSGSGDNSQRMHQLSATDWFPQAVDSDGGCSLHTPDILVAYQTVKRGRSPFCGGRERPQSCAKGVIEGAGGATTQTAQIGLACPPYGDINDAVKEIHRVAKLQLPKGRDAIRT